MKRYEGEFTHARDLARLRVVKKTLVILSHTCNVVPTDCVTFMKMPWKSFQYIKKLMLSLFPRPQFTFITHSSSPPCPTLSELLINCAGLPVQAAQGQVQRVTWFPKPKRFLLGIARSENKLRSSTQFAGMSK